ncbi:MAG: CPBP family intramembrane glutamic endopeptidase [Promethearchaeota archaeon]
MENSNKYIIIGILSIFLIMPMILGVYVQYIFVRTLDIFIFLFFLFGLVTLFIIGKLIHNYIFNKDSIELMRKHDVTNALINRNNRIVIWLFFPLTMVMEELIFRYYLIGFLIDSLKLDVLSVIFISSLIFSLYHIHTWFSYKNLTILITNLVYTFLMGLYIGFLFLNIGIVPCILIHYTLAFSLYYNIYKRYFKT